MENGEETFASPTAAAADFGFGFGPALTNGEGGHAKAYDPEEMDALRAAKRDLEEKLAEVRHENGFLSAEAARLEALVTGAREDIAAADRAAAKAEGEAAGLRAEVKRLQGLLDSSDRDADGPGGAGGDLATAHQEKLALEEEIKALKASAAAAAADKEGAEEEAAAAPSAKEGLAAPHGKVAAAAAAGAAATAAIAVVLLNLKR